MSDEITMGDPFWTLSDEIDKITRTKLKALHISEKFLASEPAGGGVFTCTECEDTCHSSEESKTHSGLCSECGTEEDNRRAMFDWDND